MDEGAPQQPTEKGKPIQVAMTRAWRAVANSFVVVIALAVLLFAWRRTRRSRELEEHYARTANNLGQQIELTYESYRRVVDVAVQNGALATQIDDRSAQSAIATKLAANDVHLAASEQQLRQVQKQFGETNSLKELADRMQLESADEQAKKVQELQAAAATAEKAQEVATESRAQARADAEAAVKASAALAEARGAVDAAQKAAADAGIEPALERVKKAEDQAEKANRTADASSEKADQAQKDARDAQDAMVQRADELREVWGKLAQAHKKQDEAGKKLSELMGRLEALQKRAPQKAAPSAADDQSTVASARGILPSYAKAFFRCIAPPQHVAAPAGTNPKASLPSPPAPPTPQEKVACAARQTARILTAETPELRIVDCPEGMTFASSARLSSDRLSLVFPPRAPTPVENKVAPVCGSVPLGQLTSSAASWSSSYGAESVAFDQVVLLDSDGNFLGMPPLEEASYPRVSALPKFDRKLAGTSSMIAKVDIGTAQYRAFLQPTTVSVGGASVTLAGLVNEERLFAESLKVSLGVFLGLAMLVGILALALPLTKVWLGGPRVRYRRTDVGWLVSSAAVATLACVVLSLAYVAQSGLSDRLDADLTTVGRAWKERLNREIEQSSTTLQDLTKGHEVPSFPKEAPSFGLDCQSEATAEDVPFSDDQDKWQVREGTGCDRGKDRSSGWKLIFWADTGGHQRAKFTPDSHASPPIMVDQRSYFRRATAEQVDSIAEGGQKVAPEVVRSVTTGEMVLIVASPTYASGPSDEFAKDVHPTGVLAIESKLDAFKTPILPFEFRAAVVDAAGRIMIHSDKKAYQGQSFLDLVNPATDLRTALAAGVADDLDIRYLGVPSRIHVERLPGVDWAVLVIAPKSLVDVPTTQLALATVLGFAALALIGTVVLSTVLTVFRFVRRISLMKGTPTQANTSVVSLNVRLRPDAHYAGQYAQVGAGMIVATAVVCTLAVTEARRLPAAATLLVVIAMALASLYCHPSRVKAPNWNVNWSSYFPLSYSMWCFGLVCVFVISPATLLFAHVYEIVTENVVRLEQAHYAEGLRYAPLSSCTTDAAPAADDPCSQVFFPAGMKVPANNQAKEPTPVTAGMLTWPVTLLLDALPLKEQTPGQDTGGFRPASADASSPRPNKTRPPNWWWDRSDSMNHLRLLWTDGGAPTMEGDLPHLVSLKQTWCIALLGSAMAIALVAALLLSYRTTRRILFLDLFIVPGVSTPKPIVGADNLEQQWEALSEDEKRVLGQLAIDGYAPPDPEITGVMERLRNEGWLSESTLTFRNEALGRFVRSKAPVETFASQEQDDAPAWAAVRAPLTALLGSILTVLGVSRPELASSGAVLPALIAGLPTVFRVLTSIAHAPSATKSIGDATRVL